MKSMWMSVPTNCIAHSAARGNEYTRRNESGAGNGSETERLLIIQKAYNHFL